MGRRMWQDRDAGHPVGTGLPMDTARDAPGQLWGLFAFGLHLAKVETFSPSLETTPAFIRWRSQP